MDIFLNVLKWSAAAGAVTALVLALKPVLDRRYSPRWRYWLWLALAALLLASPVRLGELAPALDNPAVEVSVPRVQVPLSRPTRSETTAPVTPGPSEPLETAPAAPDLFPVEAPDLPAAVPTVPAAEPEPEARAVPLGTLLTALWLTGAAVFVLWHGTATWIFARRARRRGSPAEGETAALCRELASELGLRRAPEVLVCRDIASPMALGLARPRVLLPRMGYGERELTFILRHELTHIRRRDLWYKALVLGANALHWFNPLIWALRREAGETVELLCDEAVVKNAPRADREAYCETILRGIRRERGAQAALSTHFYGGVRSVKNRFKNLLSGRSRKVGWAALIAALLAVTVCAGAVSLRSESGREAVRELWSVDLTDERVYDAATPGFGADVTWTDGQPSVVHLGHGFMAADFTLNESGVTFTLYQDAPEAVRGSVLPIRELAVYDYLRDNTEDDRRENTRSLRAALAKRFAVTLDGVTVPGELAVTGGNGHTDFTYVFDEPLTEPRDGAVHIAVGTEDWVASTQSVTPLTEAELAAWQERLEDPDWNGFVTHFYRSPQELNLCDLLYLGAGIGRELTAGEFEQHGSAMCPTVAFDRDVLDAWLRENTGVGLDQIARGLDMFDTSDPGTLYLSHGDTNFTNVTVLSGVRSGDTLFLTVEQDFGERVRGTLTIRDGKFVSFVNDDYLALMAKADELTAGPTLDYSETAGRTFLADVTVSPGPFAQAEAGGCAYRMYAVSYRLVPGPGEGPMGPEGPETAEVKLTFVLRQDQDGFRWVCRVLDQSEAETWRGRWDELIQTMADSETGEVAQTLNALCDRLFAGDYTLTARVTQAGVTTQRTFAPEDFYFSPESFRQELQAMTWAPSAFSGLRSDRDGTLLELTGPDGMDGIRVTSAGGPVELTVSGDARTFDLPEGDREALWQALHRTAEYAEEEAIWEQKAGGDLTPEEAIQALAREAAESVMALPDWLGWRPEDFQVTDVSVTDEYLGDPREFCGVMGFAIKLASDDPADPARNHWEVGAGLGDKLTEGPWSGYYTCGWEYSVVRNDAGDWVLRGVASGGTTVRLPGWTLASGLPNSLENAALPELLELYRLTRGQTHDHILPSYMVLRPDSELSRLPDLTASWTQAEREELERLMEQERQ